MTCTSGSRLRGLVTGTIAFGKDYDGEPIAPLALRQCDKGVGASGLQIPPSLAQVGFGLRIQIQAKHLSYLAKHFPWQNDLYRRAVLIDYDLIQANLLLFSR